MEVDVIKIKSLEQHQRPLKYEFVKVKECGYITEVVWVKNKNTKCYIKKLSDDEYLDLRNGQVYKCNKIENRSQNKHSVSQSLKRLRDYINTNVVNADNCRWITLTYADNMQDTKKLYTDFKIFNKKMRKKLAIHYEYIIACEPQKRGAWHIHMLMIFDDKAPYIDNNSILQKVWGYGFTKTKKLDDVDNIGAYLTAYLGDMSLDEYESDGSNICSISGKYLLKVIEDIEGIKKAYIKGYRLKFYPPKFNLYRCSRGIKKPNTYNCIDSYISKKVSDSTLTFEKTIFISDEQSDYENTINYRYYNSKRKSTSSN